MVAFRFSSAERAILRRAAEAAARRAGYSGAVMLRPGIRHNLNDPSLGRSINIRLVSHQPNWNDTDLFDTVSLEVLTKGIPLTYDGRGLVDFFVYDRKPDRNLWTNVQAYIEAWRLVRIAEEEETLWTPPWIAYKPGDPLPKGSVRIRQKDGWESNSAGLAEEWRGWDAGLIVAYQSVEG